MKIVLVGSDHAGIAAAKMILTNPENELVVMDKSSHISYVGAGTALWVGQKVENSDDLFYTNPDALAALGAKMLMETTVTSVDYANKVVHAEGKNGEKFEESYDKLVLATGSLPIAPNLPGKDLKGIHFLKAFEEGREVEAAMADPKVKRVGIIGAGYIGVEIAEGIRLRGKEVVMFDAEPHSLMNYYDEEFATAMDENLIENGLELQFGQLAEGYIGNEEGHVAGIKTSGGEYAVDLVINCIGFRPNADLGGEHIEKFVNGAYLVDRKQATSYPNVYAIGDCATVFSTAQGKTGYIALASNAVRSGLIAGANLAGKDIESPGVQGSNGISIFGLNMVSTGISVRAAKRFGVEVEYVDYEDTQIEESIRDHENGSVKLRIVWEKESRRIVGAQFVSKLNISSVIHMFSLAVEQNYTIDQLALLDIFYLPHFNKVTNYITQAALKAISQ